MWLPLSLDGVDPIAAFGNQEPFANNRSCNLQFRWIATLRVGRSQQVVMFNA